MYAKVTSHVALDPSGLAAIAIYHGLALFVAVATGANISDTRTVSFFGTPISPCRINTQNRSDFQQ